MDNDHYTLKTIVTARNDRHKLTSVPDPVRTAGSRVQSTRALSPGALANACMYQQLLGKVLGHCTNSDLRRC